ncbi:MAG: hypothetical protein ABI406_13775 [Ktedonobacteraceae bacterium]
MNTIFTEVPIHFLVEGITDEAVAKRLLAHAGLVPGKSFGMSGKADLLAHLPKYNQAAHNAEANPKEKLVNIVRRSTTNGVRNDFVPRQGSGAHVGPRYVKLLNEFTEKYWRPEVAAKRSGSLNRCIDALSAVKGTILEW